MTLKLLPENTPWYAEGLRFQCTNCGECCTGAPGYVWINEQEIERMSTFLNLSVENFSNRYVRRIGDRLSLIELPKTYDCIFLKDKKCQIYSVRPTQCRTYPWWPQHLKSKEDWEEAARYCPGIHLEAPLVSREIIDEQCAIQQTVSPHGS